MPSRLVVGISGQRNLAYGVRVIELLAETAHESHVVLSADAREAAVERNSLERIEDLATVVYDDRNIGASPASGSFDTDGMIVAPCSSGTMAKIAHGESGTLITRAADVTLKERRPLVVMPIEYPLSRIHITNMLDLTDAGGIVVPPFPSFYQQPNSVDEVVDRTIGRALTFFDVDTEFEEWQGVGGKS